MDLLLKGFLSVLRKSVLILPTPLALGLGKAFGVLAFFLFFPRTLVAARGLKRTLGRDKGSFWVWRTIFQMYLHFGMNASDFIRLPLLANRPLNDKDLFDVQFEGIEHARAVLQQGRGILVLTAHLGNWELMAASIVRQGIPVNVINRGVRQPVINDWLNGTRSAVNVRSIHKKNAMREIITCLKKNELVGFVLDQRVNAKEGVPILFMGLPATTISGLAVLSMRYDIPVVPMFIHRESGNRHRINIEPPITFQATGSMEEDILRHTQIYSDILERYVKSHPEQWIWIHKRWGS